MSSLLISLCSCWINLLISFKNTDQKTDFWMLMWKSPAFVFVIKMYTVLQVSGSQNHSSAPSAGAAARWAGDKEWHMAHGLSGETGIQLFSTSCQQLWSGLSLQLRKDLQGSSHIKLEFAIYAIQELKWNGKTHSYSSATWRCIAI